MILILDTNVYQSDYRLRSTAFRVLRDILERTESRVVFPRVVAEELRANVERDIQREFDSLHRLRRAFAALPVDQAVPTPTISAADAADTYLSWLRAQLAILDEDLLQFEPWFLEDAIKRSVSRTPPCSSQGEEIRDAVLWCEVKNLAASAPGELVVFVSHDLHFAEHGKGPALHPRLAEELKSQTLDVEYHPSLRSFVTRYETQCAFVTQEWVESRANLSHQLTVNAAEISAAAEDSLRTQSTSRGRYTGHASYISGALNLKAYRVYELTTGGLNIEVSTEGHAEFECEIELGIGPSTIVECRRASLTIIFNLFARSQDDIEIWITGLSLMFCD